MPSFDHILITQHGSRMFVGTQNLAGNFYLQGKLSKLIWHTLFWQCHSLDGQVKLFDLRGADFAAMTWDLQPKSLSAFDVHSISGVFAAYVFFAASFERRWFLTLHTDSTSAINHTSWRSQRVVVRSLLHSEPLSTSNIPTGLSTFPIRGIPSPFIPRHSSLVFHPTEMLYAMGGPDGTGKPKEISFCLF